MPLLSQLVAETYWQREIVTAELSWLGGELCRRTGRPAAAAGSKGDQFHLSGAHRSQEWILNSRWCTNRTYTVQNALTADQTRHIAGFDFTPGAWGTPANRALMATQTRRLLTAMQAGQLDEVRELFGTLNGATVTGWNNVTNRTVTSDTSHLDHWHLTFDRRHLRNRPLMERVVNITLGEEVDLTPEQDRMLRNLDRLNTAVLLDGDEVTALNGDQAYPFMLAQRIKTIETAVAGLAVPAPAPVDQAALRAALLDPGVLGAIAAAVVDEQRARLES